MITNFSKAKKIPSVSTKKSAPTTTNFAKGIYTYKPNDTMDYDEVYLAQNARFDRIGEYKTRRGLSPIFHALGATKEQDNYADSYTMVSIPKSSSQWVAATEKPLYSVHVTLAAATADDYGVARMTAKNAAGDVLGVSCQKVTSTTPTETTFLFKDGVSGAFHVELDAQGPQAKNIQVATITGGTLMAKTYCATKGKVIAVFDTIVNGYKNVLFAFKNYNNVTAIYRADPQWNISLIRTLPSGVNYVRFQQNDNNIRYTDGVEGPRLINGSTWADTAITTTDLKTGTNLNIKVSNILDGTEDNIMYFNSEVTTEAVWTWPYGTKYNNSPINSYDKFNQLFYQNFPALNTGDPLTAMFNLGGVVYFLTKRNKYSAYFQTADVWTPQSSSAQHGTFTQESCVCNLNYAYYACDDGIYVFDGSSEASITEKSIQNTYDAISGKESIVLELYKNRLYVFYSSNGDGENDSCLIYNINLGLWESFDTGTSVSASCARKSPSNRFICGSSTFCQLFWYENDGADYDDAGAPIDFDLETAYMHFGTPSQLHRITKWRPEFSTVDGDYTVKCGYAVDFTDDVKYAYSINLKNNTPVDEHYVWDNPPAYGGSITPTKLTTIPKVYGQFRRCQIRYQHHAAFEPVNFKSHTLTIQTERIR